MPTTPSAPIRRALVVGLGLAAALALGGAGVRAQNGPVRLFNGRNFDGWYTFIPPYGRNSDPLGIFKIEDGVIHVSGEKFGYLSTEKEYGDYRLTVEFRWGQKKYPPRENAKRDAGILYHCVGPDKVWMKSLEFQIQEGDCGDMWLTPGEGGAPALTVMGKRYVGGRVVKFTDAEKPHGEWNTCVVLARGDTIRHYMNGVLVMEGTEASLTRGKINLQSEGAEVYYRAIVLEPLD